MIVIRQCCTCCLAAVYQGCLAWAGVTLWSKRAVAYVVLTFRMHKEFFSCLLLKKNNLLCEECSQVGI